MALRAYFAGSAFSCTEPKEDLLEHMTECLETELASDVD